MVEEADKNGDVKSTMTLGFYGNTRRQFRFTPNDLTRLVVVLTLLLALALGWGVAHQQQNGETMTLLHYISKECAYQFPELTLWDIRLSKEALAIEPDDLVEMLKDHAVETPNYKGVLRLSAFLLDYINDRILMLSKPKEPFVVVITQAEVERLLPKL